MKHKHIWMEYRESGCCDDKVYLVCECGKCLVCDTYEDDEYGPELEAEKVIVEKK